MDEMAKLADYFFSCQITNMEDDPNWYTAELTGRKGYVPKNYIELRPHTYVSVHLI